MISKQQSPLSKEQIAFFNKNGYLTIPQFANRSQLESLKTEIRKVIADSPHNNNAIFSTSNKVETDLTYFLESGDKIRCFFEEKRNTDGSLAVNKVGHALHQLNPLFTAFSENPSYKAISSQIGHKEPVILQSQYILKLPGVGGEVVPHTDSTFLYTDPETCLGFWLALDNATQENGCLWVIPGSQEIPLQERYVRTENGKATKFIPMTEHKEPLDLSEKIPLEVIAGDLVLLHGRLLHFSEANRSEHSRHAFVLHFVDNSATYPQNNWLQSD